MSIEGLNGILGTLSVLVGAWVAAVQDPDVVLIIGLVTCATTGLSGLWRTYRTWSIRRQRYLQSLEQAMLLDLEDTRQARVSRLATRAIAY